MELLVTAIFLIGLGSLAWIIDYFDGDPRDDDPSEEENSDRISKLEKWNVNWSHPEVDDSFYTWDPKDQKYKETFDGKMGRTPEQRFCNLRNLFEGAALGNREALQVMVGVEPDGVFGPETYRAMSDSGSWNVLEEILYPFGRGY